FTNAWNSVSIGVSTPPPGPIAQLDRASGYEPGGRRFESCWARQSHQSLSERSRRRGLGFVNNRDQLVADRLDASRTDPPTICVYTFNVVSTFACPINCATTFPDTRRSCDHDAYVRRNVTTPQVRTYGEIVGHLINANYSFCSAALSDQNPN